MADESPHARHILVVEDDDVARDLVAATLRARGDRVDAVATGEDGLEHLERELYDVVLLDLHLPRMQGLSVLSAAASLQMEAQFVVMTAFGSVDSAVEAMRLGAYDYLMKPFRTDQLLLAVDGAWAESELRREVAQLRRHSTDGMRSRLIGRAPAMQRLFDLIERVAPLRATVLITGETGTGKELVARAIHESSPRARRPFVPVNCSALSDTLLESELFGHVKGSFTGAVASRRGLFEEASGGTLFLDEVSAISAHAQVTLLRVLEERQIHRVGSSQPMSVDFRLIAATNEDLAARVAAGTFREDLYYRLNVFPIHVPPLRERASDIPLLANYFRMRFAQENGIEPPPFAAPALGRMASCEWPGNVRELEHYVERAVILSLGASEIRFQAPDASHRPEHDMIRRALDEDWNLDRLEREHILAVLERTGGHQGHAADILGIDRRTLYRKLRSMNDVAMATA